MHGRTGTSGTPGQLIKYQMGILEINLKNKLKDSKAQRVTKELRAKQEIEENRAKQDLKVHLEKKEQKEHLVMQEETDLKV